MYWIVTDATADLMADYVAAQDHFLVVNMTYTMDGVSYEPLATEEDAHRIYQSLRDGKVITTAQINSERWKDAVRPLLQAGEDVLMLIFSSALSGTCHAAMMAGEELREEFPDRKVMVIDTLSASVGEGLLAHLALENRANGMSLEDNAQWVEDHKMNINHWFTVDDLMYLLRGGRLSAASAVLGTMIRIKPILQVDTEGKLVNREKVAGRKRSIRTLIDKTKDLGTDLQNQTVFIGHGDCREEAEAMAAAIKEQLGVRDVIISTVGPIVGSHTGPGILITAFMGQERK